MTKATIDIYPVTAGWMARVQFDSVVYFRVSAFRWLARRRAIALYVDIALSAKWVEDNQDNSLHYRIGV